jgi:PKD repeat protein
MFTQPNLLYFRGAVYKHLKLKKMKSLKQKMAVVLAGLAFSASAESVSSYRSLLKTTDSKIEKTNHLVFDSNYLAIDSIPEDTIVYQDCAAAFQFINNGDSAGVNYVSFFNASQGSNLSYDWWFGDGSSSSEENPVHIYQTAGTYTTCLTVYNNSCQNTFCDVVTVFGDSIPGDTIVYQDCAAAFQFINNGDSAGVNYVSFFNASQGSNLSYDWWFGDGSSSSEENPVHIYQAAGTYTTCLTVYNNSCQNTFCDVVTVFGDSIPGDTIVYQDCAAAFQFINNGDSASVNYVSFFNASQGSNLSYDWWFGDGSSSSEENPAHTYQSPGSYTTCLTVYNSNGCQNTFCDVVTVFGDSIIEDCPLPTNLNTVLTNNGYTLSWEADGSTQCEISGGIVGRTQFSRTVVGEDSFEYFVSEDFLRANTEYQWKVRCNCELNNDNVYGAFTDYTTFTTYDSLDYGFPRNQGINIFADAIPSEATAVKNVGRIFPNPVQVNSMLNIETDHSFLATIEIYNMQGQKMNSSQKSLLEGSNSLPIEIKNLPSGNYFIRLVDESGKSNNIKFVK